MYPPHHLGGYELACRDAVARWRRHGHDVEILTTTQRFPHASGAEEEEGVRRELDFYWRDGLVVSPPPSSRLRIERHNRRVLRRALDQTRPDVASIWHMGAMSLSMLTEITDRGLPMVLVVYDNWLVYGPRVDAWTRVFRARRWAAEPVRRLTGLHTSVRMDGANVAACFMSDWIRRRAEAQSSLQLPGRRGVVYGGIDRTTFRTDGSSGGFEWRLLCAGRVEERKGVHVAIEAMGKLPPQATLDVIGSWDDEAYVARLQRRAAELGIGERVNWRGQVGREDLAGALRAADVFLFPVVWDEPFGMAPLEAMACGTPVVGTGTGGSGEFLLDEVNCLRVTPGDADAIAEAVRRLATDDVLRESVTRRGLLTAEAFDVEQYVDELEAWHVAASDGFSSGTPSPRTPLGDLLERG